MRLFFLISAGVFLWCGCGDTLVGDSRFVMGTRISLKLVPIAGRDASRDIDALFRLATRQERRFSVGRAASLVSRLNRRGRLAGGGDPEFKAVILRGLSLASKTEGAFDPFILPLTRLWGFSSPGVRPAPPSGRALAAALRKSGYKRVRKLPHGIRLPSGGGFDGGGYVKGWVADRIREKLLRWGYRQAIVDAGGDIALIGRRPAAFGPEDGWIVMIAHPRKAGENWCSLLVRDRAVVSSGDYERFYMYRGKRYHHILDPRTGYPSRGVVAVTVIGPSVEVADTLATAFFVSGYRKALRLLSSFPGYAFMMVDEQRGRLRARFSPGFRTPYRYRKLPGARSTIR